jgi:hypothetical protein
MRFISVRELRSDFWKSVLPEEDMVLTAKGRPVAILTRVNEDTYEKELDAIKRSRALKALDRVHRDSVMKGRHKITDEEIQTEIDAVRKEKK